jgi:hypothetical protein
MRDRHEEPAMLSRLALAACLIAAATAARAGDADAAALRGAADRADAELVDVRLALWRTLTAQQKAAFAGPERAWLNGGREAEVRQCAGTAPSAQQREQCRLQVTERHRAALAAPAWQTAAR